MPTTQNSGRNAATYVLAISLFCLSGSLIYFAMKAAEIVYVIPDILKVVEATSVKIEPVIDGVDEIKDLVIPILEEVKQTRELIPKILQESAMLRKQVSPILKEVQATLEVIPSVVAATNKSSIAIAAASKEVAETRKFIPVILDEVKVTREAIPPLLAEAERITISAGNAGKKASEGAVTGFFTGLIKAPFKLVGGFGKSIYKGLGFEGAGFTEKDIQTHTKLAKELLNFGKPGDIRVVKNNENGSELTLSILKETEFEGSPCKELSSVVINNGKEVISVNFIACKNANNEWEELRQVAQNDNE